MGKKDSTDENFGAEKIQIPVRFPKQSQARTIYRQSPEIKVRPPQADDEDLREYFGVGLEQ